MQKRKLLTRCLCEQKALLTNSVCALFEDHSHVAFLDPCQYLVLVTLPIAASPLVIVPSRETARAPLTRTPMNRSYILASVGASTAPRLPCLASPVPEHSPAIGAPFAGLPGQGSSYIIRGHAVHAHWTECMDSYANVCSASPGHPHPLSYWNPPSSNLCLTQRLPLARRLTPETLCKTVDIHGHGWPSHLSKIFLMAGRGNDGARVAAGAAGLKICFE